MSYIKQENYMLTKIKKKLDKENKVYLRVKVRPGANKTRIKEIMDNEIIKIDIAALPAKGKANQELIKFIARELAVNQNNVKIISGLKIKNKLIKVIK